MFDDDDDDNDGLYKGGIYSTSGPHNCTDCKDLRGKQSFMIFGFK